MLCTFSIFRFPGIDCDNCLWIRLNWKLEWNTSHILASPKLVLDQPYWICYTRGITWWPDLEDSVAENNPSERNIFVWSQQQRRHHLPSKTGFTTGKPIVPKWCCLSKIACSSSQFVNKNAETKDWKHTSGVLTLYSSLKNTFSVIDPQGKFLGLSS